MAPRKNNFKTKPKVVATKAKGKGPPTKVSGVTKKKQKTTSKNISHNSSSKSGNIGDQSSTSSKKESAVAKSKKKPEKKAKGSGDNGPSEKKKGDLAFEIRGLSAKQYAKWRPMRKETEAFLKQTFETNTNLVLSSMSSSEEYDRCQELLNGLSASCMEGLKEAKFPKPAIVNFKHLKEKTALLENQLAVNTDLYDRVQAAYEEYEIKVERLEDEKEGLEKMLEEEPDIAQLKDLNPVLHEVLNDPSLPEMVTLDERSSPAYINRSRIRSTKNYADIKKKCEDIVNYLHGENV